MPSDEVEESDAISGSEYTIGDGFFAECPRLCRVLFIGHSAKRLFAECQRERTRQTSGTRQRAYLPSATEKELGKEDICRVPEIKNSANIWHSAKRLLSRVSFFDTRQTLIFFSLLTSKLFLQSSYNTWYSMFQCGIFLGLFLYFFNLFQLIEFSWIIQIITASHSNNEKK